MPSKSWSRRLCLTVILHNSKMKNLSDKAKAYLSRLNKDKNWSTDELTTGSYLIENNFINSESLTNFQSNYSGITISIKNKSEDFSALLFSRSQIINNEELEYLEFEGRKIIECGNHQTAPFRFYITENGEICTVDSFDKLNLIHKSFEKRIEQYALLNEIAEWEEIPYYYNVVNQNKLERYLADNFDIITECSDEFSYWGRNHELVVKNGKWLDKQSKYFKIYSNDIELSTSIINTLKNDKILN